MCLKNFTLLSGTISRQVAKPSFSQKFWIHVDSNCNQRFRPFFIPKDKISKVFFFFLPKRKITAFLFFFFLTSHNEGQDSNNLNDSVCCLCGIIFRNRNQSLTFVRWLQKINNTIYQRKYVNEKTSKNCKTFQLTARQPWHKISKTVNVYFDDIRTLYIYTKAGNSQRW